MVPWQPNQLSDRERVSSTPTFNGGHHLSAGDVRRSRTTLYLITACYVIIGFVIAIPAALGGDRVSTFLGFLIIGGALGVAAAVNIILKVIERLSIIENQLTQVVGTLHSLDESLNRPPLEPFATEEREAPLATSLIDLSNVGTGDPSELVAASLERDRFPRLVATMEDKPPAQSSPEETLTSTQMNTSAATLSNADHTPPGQEHDSLTTKNLLREWKIGLRNQDLSACRKVYAALVDTTDEDALRPLDAQLQHLSSEIEHRLRDAFSSAARARDFPGMVAVGEQMVELLPDHRVSKDFQRLESFLRSQVSGDTDYPKPNLRVVP